MTTKTIQRRRIEIEEPPLKGQENLLCLNNDDRDDTEKKN